MTIRRLKSLSELKPGEWVNLESPLRYSFAGSIAQVKNVLSATAVVEVYKSAGTEFRTVKPRNIVYVCDNMKEANNMREASLKSATRALKLESRLTAKLRQSTAAAERAAIRECAAEEPTPV